MSEFRTATDLRILRGQFREKRQLFALLGDVRYYSDLLGAEVMVPRDYVTDLASTPRAPIAYAVAGGLANEPAVIHDWLYTTHAVGGKPIDRKTADDVLLEAIRVSGDPYAPGRLMWLAVRLGGQASWSGDGPNQPSHVADAIAREAGAG